MRVLTVNAGSSTIKFGVFDQHSGEPVRIARATIDLRHAPPVLGVATGPEHLALPLDGADGSIGHIGFAVAALERQFAPSAGFGAVGHRVVHGGDDFAGATRLDGEALGRLEELVPLAPLHQPQNLEAIRSLWRSRPGMVQVAAFDTAFHQTLAPLQRRFALPRALHEAGVKRYGFHGLSYTSIMRKMRALAPELAKGRVIVAHLGSGPACAPWRMVSAAIPAWGSRRWTACPWPRAAARWMPGSCCIFKPHMATRSMT